MQAVVLESFGGPEMLKVREVATPEPRPGEILVKVRAAGVCHHDVLHRAGKLPGAKAGVVLGHETAGEVVKLGAGVHTHRLGDRVVVYQRRFCGVCRSCLRGRQDMCRAVGLPAVDTEGGYAEYVSVPAEMGIAVPAGVDWRAAALACCPVATSYRALCSVARMQPGDAVLVTGASGGLGVHQLQLVRAFGGRSIAVTSDAKKADFLRRAGADEVVVAKNGAFGAEVWRLTGKRGVDIALENVGPTLPETLRTLTTGGTAVVLGNIGGDAVPVLPGLLIGRRLRVQGSGMAPVDEVRQAIALIAAGLVKPVISTVVGFADAAQAHRLLEARSVEGRVVLEGW
jgi:D-arabinose 1-dehydrogenase-like Zn-dependent alcohol dehydrogenase